MDNLESKYRSNKLTCDELLTLRNEVNTLNDKEIFSSLESSWNSHTGADISAPSSCYENIKRKTHNSIKREKTNIFNRISQIAAAVLIPLLIATSFYFYNETKISDSKIMTISTGVGERANITLPDGTKVAVNTQTTLSYAPNTFSKSERMIQFEGEAYFDVKKEPSTPFIIKTTDVRVEVLGTKFNLSARTSNTQVELNLKQGSVLFSSLKSNEHRKVAPNQSVTMDKTTGKITLTSTPIDKTISQWRRAELNFRNATLEDVLSEIKTTYNATITIKGTIKTAGDLFTGTIPDNNIAEAIEVLERSYHIKAKIINDKITISEQ